MAIVQRFFPRDLRYRNGCRAWLLNWWRAVAPFALVVLILLLTAAPQWAQLAQFAGSNVLPLEGPGAGTDTVLVYASGLQGTATSPAMVATDANWITILNLLPGSSSINIQNGPNRLRFQFAANTGATRTGHIGIGSPGVTITVTQAGTGFAPAGPVTLIKSITGPEGIDVDPQGNLFIVDVSGSNLFEWTAATQQLSAIVTGGSSGFFVDVAIDAAGDVFALENTSDGKFGTQVQLIRATQGQVLPLGSLVFNSEDTRYLFPMGLCVDATGKNLDVTTVDVSDKCLIDQFGTVYELDSTDANENVGSFASPPTNAQYNTPPNGKTFFPITTGVDPCGNQQTGVSGSIYGLFKDGSGFIYFVDHNGTRVNRYDPTTPFYSCNQTIDNNTILVGTSFTSFTTVANLTYPAYYAAADTTGNVYLSEMAFSQVQEIPRAWMSTAGPFNEPVTGGTETIQILPATQSLTGVFAPVSNASWLNVTSAANGVVTFSISPNPGRSRSATITVLGVPIQVAQGEAPIQAALTIVSGNNQQAAVGGLPFATNLLVKVTNQWGDAMANVPVTFSSPSQNIPVTTDQRGYAADTGVNAYAVGPNTVTASIPGGISQTFALKGVPNGISVVSGSNQQVGYTGLFAPMTVQVFGTSGQPAANVPVTFSAPASGPSGTFPGNVTTITVNTLDDGTASTSVYGAFQANTALGSYVMTASISGAPGVTASSCAFNLNNFGPVTGLVGDESAFVNNAYPGPLSLRVVDNKDQPVANVPVNFVVGLGGGNGPGAVFPDGTSSIVVQTGPDGIATTPPMIATANAGTFTASGFVNNLPSGGSLTAGWTLTNLPSAILEGALQTGPTTRTLTQPFIVKASANATAGTMVFTVVPGAAGAGGSFDGPASVTVNLDSQGYGTSPLLLANSTPGTFTVTADDGVTTSQSTITTAACLNPNSSSVPVTTTADYNPQYPATTVTGSLRYVLANACAASNIDLTALSGTINLQSRLRIDDNLTITGPGAGTLAIDGGNATRLFFIGDGLVTISNLTLQNGLAQGGGSVFGGGGAGMGGAIFMEGGEVTLTNVTFNGNKAVGGGAGVAAQCTTNCLYGGGGFLGTAGNGVAPNKGGSSGDLFGVPGPSNGASGGPGGGGAGGADNGGTGGFGAGGGTGNYHGGVTSSGNGGFGAGGGGGLYACMPFYSGCPQVVPGSGGYGAGNGYDAPFSVSVGFGGSGAGFGGAIFEYAGQLTLNGVQFLSNSALGGTLAGLSGQPTVAGQGKGGAVFIYNGAVLINNSSTFGTNGTSNVAAAAGLPGNGNSAAPYTSGATCPGQDTVDICGVFGNTSATTVTLTVPTGQTFFVDGVLFSGSHTLALPQGQHTLAVPGPQSTGVGSQTAFASWSDGGGAVHAITVGPGGMSLSGSFVTQYQLTISAGAGGATAPASGGYYNAGSVVNVNATPNAGSAFINWTGTIGTSGSAATEVLMNAPQTVMANFAPTQLVNVSVPSGVSFTLNGTNYSGSQFVRLPPGQYALSTTSPQPGTTGGQQLAFNSWSDGGALSHTITVGPSAFSISGNFTTQYQLTTSEGSGGTVSSVNGFYNPGTVVNVTAFPFTGSVFHAWTGTVASSYLATTTVTMNQPTTIIANFWPAPTACVGAPPDLTAWWTAENNFNDLTGAFNATGGGDVSFAPGRVGRAFSFDGTQSPFVSIPAGVFPPQPGNGAFSFEAWFQTSGGHGGVILGQQASAPYGTPSGAWSPAIYVGTDGNLYVEMFYDGGVNQSVGPAPVNDNQWHHVAVTYDGTFEVAYLDGMSIGQISSYTQASNGSNLSYQLGTGYTSTWPATNGGWYTFNGLIDEAAVYSRALTAAEVLGIAQAGTYGKCTGSTRVQVALTGGSNPSTYAQPVTFTATISATSGGNLTGIVNWSNSTGCSTSTLNSNPATATCTTTLLPAGSDQVTAFYQGDSGHGSSGASISETVNQPATPLPSMISVGSSRNPSTTGQTIIFSADVNPVSGGGRPTGTVQFVIDGVNFGPPVSASSATSMGTSTLSIGNHTVTATYSGDGNFTGSSATLSGGQTVVDGNNVQSVLGDNQTGATMRTLAQPFILQTAGNPVAGNAITFTVVPGNGAGGTFGGGRSSVTVATDSNGYATSPQLIANSTPGSFTVTGSDGSETAIFNVSTTQCVTPRVTNPSDSASGSLRDAVDHACPGSTIDLTGLFGTVSLINRIRIDDNLTITGPGANALTISGLNQTRIFFIGGGTVSISGVTLANGLVTGVEGGAGGAAAGMGGAIFMNGGTVNLTGVTFSGNSAVGTRSIIAPRLGGAGIGGAAIGGGNGGPGGDLFGMGGNSLFGATGGTGGPGAGGGFPSGNGGFGGGGAVGGNGGFGGGGGGNDTFDNGTVNPGTGGYGAADGTSSGVAGASAGFGGAIFEYAGTLTLLNDTFTGNSAIGGISSSGNGQGKGGALFVYSGATAYNNGSSFSANTAADAGSPGIGNSAAPYVNGATCPGEDDTDTCGILAPQPAATLSVALSATGTFKQGSTAEWDVTVANAAGSLATSAAVSMQDTLPAGYTVSGFGSTDTGTWSCSGSGTQTAACSAVAQLAGGQSYPVIHLIVNVPVTSSPSVTDTALAFGGGDPVHTNVNAAASGSSTVSVAQVAANIAVASGSGQSTATGVQFTQPLVVVVSDSNGNPVPGVTVMFSAPAAGASATLSASSPTDSNGHASVIATANSIPGTYQVTASISGAATSFSLTNVYNGPPPPPSVCVGAPANLTAWWRADNNFNDVTGAYNATAGGNVSFGSGEAGQAFSFDGTLNPYVTIPAGVFPYPASGAFSFETWFNTKQGGVIIGLQSGNATPYGTPPTYTPGIYVGTDGKLYAQMFYNQSIRQSVSSGTVNDGNWHHVAVTYDGSNQIAYLDGSQIGLLASFSEVADGSAPYQFQLGTGYTNAGWPNTPNGWYTFNGLIDEAAVYGRALSASEVQGLYFAGAYGKCDPAIAVNNSLNFGNVSKGGSVKLSATLSNPGNAALAITTITLDGGDTNFSLLSGIAGDCAVGTPVAAGGSCNIRVSFAPGALGSLSGSVMVTDNSLYLGGTQTVQLQGTGTAGTAVNIAVASGSGQSAATGVPFTQPLVVLVSDNNGIPVPGVTVTFSAPAAGAGATLSASSPTDSNGHASVIATANSIPGTYQVTAGISGATTSFSLTNVYNGTPPPPSVCVGAPANLTAWWRAENNFNDVTGSYNATAGGNVGFGNGKAGQAFSFDGTLNPYVTIPGGVFPYPASGAFSFETWFNTKQGGVIIGLQSGNATPYGTPPTYTPGIYVGTDGKLYAQMFYNQSVQQSVSSGTVNDGNWHHVAVTYDGSNQIAYLDGAQIGLLASFSEVADGSAPYQFQLGTGYANAGWPNTTNGWYTFNGLIDEAAVYGRALSASEVQGLYYAGAYGKCDPAIAVNSSLNFGNVSKGAGAKLGATLSNPGNAALAISAITLDGGDTNFSVLSGIAGDCAVGTPVQPNASCNVRVQFNPQGVGSFTGTVTIHDNSLMSTGTQTIQLSGTVLTTQTITFGAVATQAVGIPLSLMATASSALPVSFTSSTPTVCTVTGTTAAFAASGSCTIIASQSGNSTYAAATPVSRTFAVLQPQTITFGAISAQMVAIPLTLSATASSGLPVTYTSSPAGVCTVSGNTVTFIAGGTCTIKASQAGNSTYLAAAPVMESFTVSKQSQSITWATIPTQAVQQTVALTASVSSGLALTYSSSTATICTVSGNSASLIAGGTCTIKATQAGNAAYSAQTASQSFLVNKLTQAITFTAISTAQNVGGTATLSATADSGLITAVKASQAAVCTISGATVSFIAAGTCTLTATQPGNTVYAAAASVAQTITVSKISQTISFPAIAAQNVSATATLGALATSGLDVTYTASPASVCTIAGNTVSFVGAGTCTLKAAQAGNVTWSAATTVTQTIAVTKVAQTITFAAIAAQNVSATVTLGATATSGLDVTYTASPASVCTVAGNTASFIGAGTCTLKAAQAGNVTYSAATTVTQTIAVTKVAQTITFPTIPAQNALASVTLGAEASSGLAITYTASPVSVCTVSASTATMVGSGTCTIKAAQAGDTTYAAATSVSQTVTVSKLAQTITFNAIAAQTVGTPLTLSASASSSLAVTFTSSTKTVCTVSGATVTMVAGGTCIIMAAQAGNAAYSAAIAVPQSFEVNKLSQTITFGSVDAQTVGIPLTLTATASSNLAVTYTAKPTSVCKVSGSTVTMVAAGPCTITAAQAGNTVYSAATAVPQSFEVTP